MSDLNMNRRQAMLAGSLGTMSLQFPGVVMGSDEVDSSGVAVRSDKSCIFVLLCGGPSHVDTWDMKPNAPAEYRGAFGATSTNVPGIQICDMLPQCAAVQNKWSIIRSLHHTNAGHSAGDQILFTGHPPGSDLPSTWRLNNEAELSRWITGRTSTRWGWFFTRCSPANCRAERSILRRGALSNLSPLGSTRW